MGSAVTHATVSGKTFLKQAPGNNAGPLTRTRAFQNLKTAKIHNKKSLCGSKYGG